jgi:D-amino peptidase
VVIAAQVRREDPPYQPARKYLTEEVNACVDGCLRGGATAVMVRDAHGRGYNFLWEDLDPRAEYIQGNSGRERMPDIGKYDGLILLGYHAMAGTPQAVLEHTMSSGGWQNFWMNGKKSGEIGIDAGIASDHGVPTVMVSGDDKACREARRFLPGVVTVEVKKGLDCEGAKLLPPERAHDLIRKGAAEAVRKCRSIKPVKVKHPVTMRLELVSRGRVPAPQKGIRVVDGRTFEVTARTVEEALDRL